MSEIDHPSYYGSDTTYETIKVIEAWQLDFCLGNAVKYISRAGKKDPEKDRGFTESSLVYPEKNSAIGTLKVHKPSLKPFKILLKFFKIPFRIKSS